MVNEWAKKSFELLEKPGYLDKLGSGIYTILDNPQRDLEGPEKERFEKLFNGEDDEALFLFLLNAEKRPINDSYFASFLKTGSNKRGESKGKLDLLLKNNPATIKEICSRVRGLKFEDAVKKMEAPKDPARQMGPKFTNWIKRKYPSESDEAEFLRSEHKITVFDTPSDAQINAFVKKHLCNKIPRSDENQEEKGIDFLVKVRKGNKDIFVCGESKFLTDFGGTQNNQFKDAHMFITSTSWQPKSGKNVERCAVIDGVCWMNWKKTDMQKKIKNLHAKQYALSALLLDDFLKSLL